MRKIFIILFLSLFASLMQAQITIQGNVFGGARQADVGGSTFVNIGGEKTTCDIIITAVYGGNDIRALSARQTRCLKPFCMRQNAD